MPNVTATPRGQSNGEEITEFIDTASTTATTYTYPTPQEKLKVKNVGNASLQFTVNGGSVATLLPYESREFSGSIESFSVSSIAGVQPFEAVGTNYKDKVIKNSSVNLFNKNDLIKDTYIVAANGNTLSGANFYATNFIPIKPDTSYTITGLRHLAFYTANKTYITGQSGPNAVTVAVRAPSNAAFVRISIFLTDTPVNRIMMNEGRFLLPFEEIGAEFPQKEFIPARVTINLPQAIYGVVGKEISIYFPNILNIDVSRYKINVICDIGAQQKSRWTCTPAFASTFPWTMEIYDDDLNVVATSRINFIVKAATVGTATKKALFIGDSMTNAATMTQRPLDIFATDSMKLTLYGSRGTTPNFHEGRGGWTAADYLTNKAYADSVVNPFYDAGTGTFNFSTYMTAKAYPALDYVFIQLGTNDTFGFNTDADALAGATTALNAFDTMINSIKAQNASTKVALLLTIPPNESQDAFGASQNSGQNQWRYKRNNFLWVKELFNRFGGRESERIYLVPVNAIVDCAGNMTDHVHPSAAGYNQMGDLIYYWIKSFEV